MKYKDAIKLHNEDEVIIKKTGEVRSVVEIIVTPKEHTTNNIPCVDILLDDGDWYGYKEVK